MDDFKIVFDDIEREDDYITGIYWNRSINHIYRFVYYDDCNIDLGDKENPWSPRDADAIKDAIRLAVAEY